MDQCLMGANYVGYHDVNDCSSILVNLAL